MISIHSSGSFKGLEDWLMNAMKIDTLDSLRHFGQEGVAALEKATPKDSGETARSWTYEIVKKRNSWSIIWSNTHDANGTPVAVLLQLGHGTGTGGYVPGIDYINPALKPIFDRAVDQGWKVVMTK